jgi:RNA polymerase sigma-70 factor (ECF subfamily)
MMDKDEFCERIQTLQNAMYSLAYSIVKNEEDACDVIGEAILHAYSALDQLRNSQGFKTWMLRIVHNTAVDYLRKQSHLVDVEDIEVYADRPEEETVDAASRLHLREAVDGLKQPYRTVVTLFYYEGLPTAKIAQITGVSVVTVRKQLFRARKQLRDRLKQEDFTR